MANILTIKEKLDKGELVTIPTQCVGTLLEQADAHLRECDWLVQVRGDVTHIRKPNATLQGSPEAQRKEIS